jgi:hypothetical protein
MQVRVPIQACACTVCRNMHHNASPHWLSLGGATRDHAPCAAAHSLEPGCAAGISVGNWRPHVLAVLLSVMHEAVNMASMYDQLSAQVDCADVCEMLGAGRKRHLLLSEVVRVLSLRDAGGNSDMLRRVCDSLGARILRKPADAVQYKVCILHALHALVFRLRQCLNRFCSRENAANFTVGACVNAPAAGAQTPRSSVLQPASCKLPCDSWSACTLSGGSVVQNYTSPALWDWQLSSKWRFAYMDLVKSMASAAQGHQAWMLAWRCGSKLLREYASSMRKEHQIEVRSAAYFVRRCCAGCLERVCSTGADW